MRYLSTAIGLVILSPFVAGAASQRQETLSSYGGPSYTLTETETTSYDGPKSRREADQDSRIMLVTHKGHTVTIERADLGKRWTLDTRHKRYTEQDMKAQKADLRKSVDAMKSEKPAKEEEPKVRIKKFETKVDGPGAPVTLHGFSCRPYTLHTTIVYESLPDHKELFTQTYFQKFWTTTGNDALAQYHKDELAFWQSESEQAFGKTDWKSFQQAFHDALVKGKANGDDASRIFADQATAYAKVKGEIVRTLSAYSSLPAGMTAEQAQAAQAPPADTKTDEPLVQPDDLSGGVSGVLGGVASRWTSHKVEKKIAEKQAEHPAWVDELKTDLKDQPAGFALMTEVTSVSAVKPAADLFEIPAGYKKVQAL